MNDTIQPIRIRRRDDRDRCVEALQIANAKGPGNLDIPVLRRLVDLPKDEFSMVMRRVFDAINAEVRGEQLDAPPRVVNCPRCDEPLEPPAPEIQIERLRQFQLSKPAYWQWSPRELRLLMEHLKPGDLVIRPLRSSPSRPKRERQPQRVSWSLTPPGAYALGARSRAHQSTDGTGQSLHKRPRTVWHR
jgi:hypothetical protein